MAGNFKHTSRRAEKGRGRGASLERGRDHDTSTTGSKKPSGEQTKIFVIACPSNDTKFIHFEVQELKHEK